MFLTRLRVHRDFTLLKNSNNKNHQHEKFESVEKNKLSQSELSKI